MLKEDEDYDVVSGADSSLRHSLFLVLCSIFKIDFTVQWQSSDPSRVTG